MIKRRKQLSLILEEKVVEWLLSILTLLPLSIRQKKIKSNILAYLDPMMNLTNNKNRKEKAFVKLLFMKTDL